MFLRMANKPIAKLHRRAGYVGSVLGAQILLTACGHKSALPPSSSEIVIQRQLDDNSVGLKVFNQFRELTPEHFRYSLRFDDPELTSEANPDLGGPNRPCRWVEAGVHEKAEPLIFSWPAACPRREVSVDITVTLNPLIAGMAEEVNRSAIRGRYLEITVRQIAVPLGPAQEHLAKP